MSELKRYKNKNNGGIVECGPETKLDPAEWQAITKKPSNKKDDSEPNESKES